LTEAPEGRNIYRMTFTACCAAYVVQAAVVNLTPVLFVPLREQYGFSYSQLGALVLANFLTQLIIDLISTPFIDKIGFRFFAVAGHVCAVVGFAVFAAAPILPFPTYSVLVAGTIIFSLGGGMFELIISPIVNSLPAKEKSASMSLLHSFYCWGQVSVALLTTLFIFIFGRESWPYVFVFWMLIPFVNIFVFAKCRLGKPAPEHKRSNPLSVIKNSRFAVLILLIICAGASELVMAQWTSAFMEDVMELPKIVGDIAGVCMFAVMMGTARTLNGVKGKGEYLRRLMFAGAALAFVCYIIAGTTNFPAVGLAACIFCGLGVSLLWPGALSLAGRAFPLAGTWLFAIMAAGGDTGASIGPWLAGVIADGTGLRVSMVSASAFPLIVMATLFIFGKLESDKKIEDGDV